MQKLRFLFASVLLTAMALSAWAQNAITIHQKDSQVATFLFTEKPVVTYSGSELVLTTAKTTVHYPIYLLQKMDFGDSFETATDVRDVKSAVGFTFSNGTLTINDAKAGTTISLYRLNGIKAGEYRIGNDGCAVISTSHLTNGLYVVKANCFTFKFHKP